MSGLVFAFRYMCNCKGLLQADALCIPKVHFILDEFGSSDHTHGRFPSIQALE